MTLPLLHPPGPATPVAAAWGGVLPAAGLRLRLRAGLLAPLLVCAGLFAGLLSGCGSTARQAPATAQDAEAPAATPSQPPSARQPDEGGTRAPRQAEASSRKAAPPIRTQHALFRLARYEDLPGWQNDDLTEAWDAFRSSCRALSRRDVWRDLCREGLALRSGADMRRFLEREFAPLNVLNTDASLDGEITGYYEPLLAGQRQPGGAFTVPVYGVPNDLYTLDWKLLPAAQRKGLATVKPNGRLLVPARPGEPGAIRLDMRRFSLSTLDRRLRVRLQGNEGLPYYTRSELLALQRLDAPVLAWVDDPLALYAMQVQGSGRIRLPDGQVLRVQYAEQNGHPFRPLRVASKPRGERIVTRGGNGSPDEPERFELLDEPEAPTDAPLTRGRKRDPAGTGGAAPSESDAVVAALLGAPGAPRPSPAAPSTPSRARTSTPGGTTGSPSATGHATALASDPSYVFFRTASDQSPSDGPVGALGVPLTAGRSVAVDPRATPLGYPVYLSAATGGAGPTMQRLVFAQDTGGAIRGAVRADYFWGFGPSAGQNARRTKHSGRMWLLLPLADIDRLREQRLVTRGAAAPAGDPGDEQPCLLADDPVCETAAFAD